MKPLSSPYYCHITRLGFGNSLPLKCGSRIGNDIWIRANRDRLISVGAIPLKTKIAAVINEFSPAIEYFDVKTCDLVPENLEEIVSTIPIR